MKIIHNIQEMARFAKEKRLKGQTIGFVPTMGALHEGHLSLIRRSCKENDFTIVSIFVNPAQFGPREDFKKYPRNLKQDAWLCKKEGVGIIFYPDAKHMYPDDYRTYVNVDNLNEVLCGKSRPCHFRGVATVVTKLFNIINPDIAYFGQKDAQQAIIIKKMVKDLNMSVKIKVMPIVREKDGLAMSSRNLHLKETERKDATVFYNALNAASRSIGRGQINSSKIIKLMTGIIHKKKSAKIDYISIVDLKNLKPLDKIEDKALIALAVWIGKTRLIDNVTVKLKGES